MNERARIGRELHDSTAQYLVAADLGVGQVLHGSAVTDDVRERLRDVQASLSAAQSEMRAFAYVLHPPELKELGLAETMARFCTGFARRSRIAITFAAGALPKELPSDAEHALFRVCQEALMNVYRHAFARTATVALEMRDRDLVLEVRDDGVGVPEDERFEGGGGVGIAGMRARMRSIGGDLRLIARGPGLTVVASVPPPFRTLAGAS